jgi:glutaredoxin
MYSTSWCGYCKKARKHFELKKIPYREYDIERSKKAALEYKKLNGRGVPVILIGKRRMNGFSANTFDKIYYQKS